MPCLEVILAASFLYKAKILVYFWSAEPVTFIDRLIVEPLHTIYLQCVGGIHFNPLKEQGYQTEGGSTQIYQVCQVTDCDISPKSDSSITALTCETCGTSTHPRIAVEYAGKNFCGILDTGAEVSLMRRSVLDKCQQHQNIHQGQDQHINIEGFTGLMGKTECTVDIRLELPDNFQTYTHTFCVVADGLIPHCMLFGVDFLTQHGLTIDGTNNSCVQELQEGLQRVNLLRVEELPQVTTTLTTGELQRHSGLEATETQLGLESSLVSLEVVKRLQQMPELRLLVSYIERALPVESWLQEYQPFKIGYKNLIIKDGMLIHRGEIDAPVVTHDFVIDAAMTAHRNMAHIGRDKLVHLLRKYMWHPRLYKTCNDICSSCSQCQLMKVSRQCVVPPTLKIATAYPFQMVSVDLVEFTRSRDGYIGCLVAIDHNSKWISVVPIKNKKSASISYAMEHLIFPCLMRLPVSILSDNGPEFVGQSFEELLRRYNIKHICSTPNKPSSNGCVERVNRTLLELLRSIDDTTDWREKLTTAVLTYNNTRHRELNMSPAEYLLGKRHESRDTILASEEDIQHWREGHPKFAPFEVGSNVMRKVPRKGHAASNKFKKRYEGPYTIEKVNDNGVTYEINKEGQRLKAHHSQLIAWTVPPLYLERALAAAEYEEAASGLANDVRVENSDRNNFIGFPSVWSSSDSSGNSTESTLSSLWDGMADSPRQSGGERLSILEESIIFPEEMVKTPNWILDESLCFEEREATNPSGILDDFYF